MAGPAAPLRRGAADRRPMPRSAPAPGGPDASSPLLELQQLAGNRAVTEALGHAARVQRAPDPAAGPSSRASELIEAAAGLAADGRTLLLADDVRDALAGRDKDQELAAAFDSALAQVEATSPEEGPIAPLATAAGDVILALERQFIHDRKRSTLDLLGPRRSRRYRAFAWDPADFPGGTKGPHEARATEMFGALADIRPERRPNSTADAVMAKREVNRDIEETIREQFVPVEGQPHHKLHRTAAASFVAMRQAAEAEGVTLHILDADRRFAASRKRAAKAKNKKAIADFSSHNLGLAVDLRLSARRQRFRELRTSFDNVVNMTAAPAHKWLLLRGASFGWYPYLHEPWHWEYNPPGFRDVFRASIGLPEDAKPPAGDAAEEDAGEVAEGPAEAEEQESTPE